MSDEIGIETHPPLAIDEKEAKRRRNLALIASTLFLGQQSLAYGIHAPSLMTGPNRPTVPRESTPNPRLDHYGNCPRCQSVLRKKGSKIFCKGCGYRKRR